MTDNIIITIGRQFGSGGHEIGNRLSKRLDIPLYDHNLIKMAAKELNITLEMAERVDESILERYMSSAILGSGDYVMFMNGHEVEEPLSDKVFEIQTKLIQKLAERSSCIIVGRCADYILGDYSNCNTGVNVGFMGAGELIGATIASEIGRASCRERV